MWRLACVLLCCAPLGAQPAVLELLESKTLAGLRRYDESFEGALGVSAIDLTTGRSFALNGDNVFPQASVIKIPILMRMFQDAAAGRFRMEDRVTLAPSDAVPGSGRLQTALKKGPVTLTVRELVTHMIETSDNTATNKCIAMAGMDRINGTLEELGLRQTRLKRIMMDGGAARRDDENVSTPNEMARLVEMIYRGRFHPEILQIMRKVQGGIQEGLPPDLPTATKTGQIPGVRGESGVVYLEGRPFVLSVMSSFIDDRHTPVPEVTRIVYRHFAKLAASNRYGHRVK